MPSVIDRDHWAHWLRDQTPAEAVVVTVPFVIDTSELAHEMSTRAMFHQMTHRRPLVDGYSGFFPQMYKDLRTAMKRFPDEPSLNRLQLHGVRYCVVEESRLTPAAQQALNARSHRLPRRYADPIRRVVIHELLRAPPAVTAGP